MLEGFDESTSWFDRLMRRFKRAGTAVVRIVGKQEVELPRPISSPNFLLARKPGAIRTEHINDTAVPVNVDSGPT
jgi:hypothetical protein